jgi:type IV pilus biogenesis protein CpaD/CtpE
VTYYKFKSVLLAIGGLALAGCASNHDQQDDFILGAATDKNIATQSIRSVDVPNSKGLTGQSGERAVAAITRLNSGEQTELSDVSSSGIGSSNDD